MVLHWQIRTGSDSIFAYQDWTRTEKFRSPLISATCNSIKSDKQINSILYAAQNESSALALGNTYKKHCRSPITIMGQEKGRNQ